MYSLGLLALSSFLLAFFLTPLCRNLFRRWGLVDRPDGGRHLHARPIPRAGGIPIVAAYLGAFAVLLLSPLAAGGLVAQGLPLASRIFPAAALVFAIGLADDLHGLKPWHKLAAQAAAGCVAFWAGVQVTAVAGFTLPPWLSLPFTLLWLAGCSNAFNLIDGVDGLAAGAGLFATVTILLGALLTNNVALALATVPLAGALLGFLRYNFNPASIFLGDSGSLTIGFLLGSYGVVWSQKSATVLGMTAPLMALAVPLLDTTIAIARRFLRGQPIFTGDAGHIHHRLLARGLTPRRVALLLYGACGLAAGLSLLSSVAQNQYKGLIILVFCAAAWIGVQHLGYVEFGLAGRLFISGAFRRHLSNELALRAFEDSLAKAVTPEDCWGVIREACRKFGFTQAELCLNGHRFVETLAETNGNPTWGVDIPLAAGGHVHLARCFGESPAPTVLVPFAEALHNNLLANGALHHQPPPPSEAGHAKAHSAGVGA
jgi:UDP-GlcNAc:undecaprenyl-phosphate GlcNAc-1-phosphate transferase